MKRVVSVTPMAVQRDSRTYKQAASVARLGFESVVVEGEPSRFAGDGLPFRLTAGTIVPQAAGVTPPRERRLRALLRRLARAIPRGLAERLKHAIEPFYFMAWFLHAYGPRTARCLPPASLYYLHSYRQFPGVWLRIRKTGTPFIYDAHDFYPVARDIGQAPTLRDRLINRFLIAIERRCVARAAEVITVGEGVAELMEREFGRRPLIVRNCHDPRIDTEPQRGLRAALGLGPEAFVVVTVGNAKEGGATAQAIEAMGQLPAHVHLAFVGAGYERYESEIERRGLAARVHLVDPVAPTEVVPFIASADLAAVLYFALTPDYLHSLPNRFFSAVGAGLPLLYPTGLPELGATAERHGLGLGIDPRDPSELAAAIGKLVDDPELLERYRQNAGQARSALTWEAEEGPLDAALALALGRAGS